VEVPRAASLVPLGLRISRKCVPEDAPLGASTWKNKPLKCHILSNAGVKVMISLPPEARVPVCVVVEATILLSISFEIALSRFDGLAT